jgi:hypothetical protein
MDPRIKSAGDGGGWHGADSNRPEHASIFHPANIDDPILPG